MLRAATQGYDADLASKAGSNYGFVLPKIIFYSALKKRRLQPGG